MTFEEWWFGTRVGTSTTSVEFWAKLAWDAAYAAGRKEGMEAIYSLTLGEAVECSCLDGCEVCDNANAKLRAIRQAIREAANK